MVSEALRAPLSPRRSEGNGERLVGRVGQSEEAEGDPGIPQLILQPAARVVHRDRDPGRVYAAGLKALVSGVPFAWMHSAVFGQDPPNAANVERAATERNGDIAVATHNLIIHRMIYII